MKFLRGLSDVRARQGERVVLWCELCKARGDVVWRKDGRVLAPGPRRQMTAEGRERSLVLSRVEPGDAGEYCCESNDDQTLATLTVQGEPEASPPPRGTLFQGGGRDAGTVMSGLQECSASLQDRGSLLLYPDNPAVVPRVVEIIMELQSLTVLEGEDATFKCLVSPEDVAVTWQLNGQPVVPSERLLVTRNGLCHSLTLRQCQPGDAGTVTANAEGLVSTARLNVQGEGEGESWGSAQDTALGPAADPAHGPCRGTGAVRAEAAGHGGRGTGGRVPGGGGEPQGCRGAVAEAGRPPSAEQQVPAAGVGVPAHPHHLLPWPRRSRHLPLREPARPHAGQAPRGT